MGILFSFFGDSLIILKPNTSFLHKKRRCKKITGVFQYMKNKRCFVGKKIQSDVNIPTFWTRQKLNAGEGFIPERR